ncbi:hypothetical protein GUITHDRAFT_98989 [Guillardia theta CCMP2712]|uniref:Uncharacterized protein n=1 Tax=Guillardia theta (strain CCMP2712) TaxID=905079 RepID=L1K3N1_GUITC|nr:hypothetical protein GUITHDRAFT_98989 [Guillardia theta CCMP2712]EKX55209.1 hypothetical protein GUITHDRAFT_98989 [Guillardia theta CCMP2712]|eukprot:XP_005842189.1 hypothetical protein GUITHDRAFT_98989 [Guillardia theta CCMP2712]
MIAIKKGPTPAVGYTGHIPSLRNADVPPGKSFSWLADQRDRLVKEGTGTWSGAPSKNQSSWMTNYSAFHNVYTYPDSHFKSNGMQRSPSFKYFVGANTKLTDEMKAIGEPTPPPVLSSAVQPDVKKLDLSRVTRGENLSGSSRPGTSPARSGKQLFMGWTGRAGAMAGWTGHLPQKQSNTYNVGLTHAAAYENVQARKDPQDFHVRSGTPIAGLSAFVPRAKDLSPGLSHRQVCRSARSYQGEDPRYAPEKSFTARFGQSDRVRPETARTARPSDSDFNARKVIVGSKVVTVNAKTGEAKTGGFNINSFANESAGGRSKNPIPKMKINSDGLVQLNPNAKANLYIDYFAILRAASDGSIGHIRSPSCSRSLC